MSSSMSSINMFDARVVVTAQMEQLIMKAAEDLAKRAVSACASHYNFDGEEALRLLNLNYVRVSRKEKVVGSSAKKSKIVVAKASFPLPYNGECNDAVCHGLRQNNGLYTQCPSARKGENMFCRSCQSSADKNSGIPEYGTIEQRNAVDIFEYVDPKGRKPSAYSKVMKKYKVSKEVVLAEAGKLGITIDENHFVEAVQEGKRGRPKAEKAPKEPKGLKGRPKKSKKVLEIEGEEEDLFASLVANANTDSDEEEEEMVLPVAVQVATKKGKSAEEREAERVAKEEEKAAKEAQRLKEKAEKEAKIAAEKAEKEAKIAAEKAEKEAKIAAEKEAKALKKQQEEEAKQAKEAQRLKEKQEKEAAKSSKSKKQVAPPVEEEEEQKPDVVKKIEIDGTKYLKSKNTGIIYDYKEYTQNGEQVVVGKWNESKNKIDFAVADEESEEEYDEDDE